MSVEHSLPMVSTEGSHFMPLHRDTCLLSISRRQHLPFIHKQWSNLVICFFQSGILNIDSPWKIYKDDMYSRCHTLYACAEMDRYEQHISVQRTGGYMKLNGDGFYVFIYRHAYNIEKYIKLVHVGSEGVIQLADFHIDDWNKQSRVIRQNILKIYPGITTDLVEMHRMFPYPKAVEFASAVNMSVWDSLTPVQADRVKRCINSWTRERMKPGGSICNRIISKLLHQKY